MTYEEINKEAVSLGFKDREEMYLYHDVCGFDIIPTFDRDELLARCYDETKGRTKDEFTEYMEQHNLVTLFDIVKYLSVYERFMTLYDNFYNEFTLTNFMLGKYKDKYNEATELYDGEKQEEYQRKIRTLSNRVNEIAVRKNNLEISALYRLEGDEQVMFYEHSEEINDYMDEMNKKGRGRKH